ncbi:lipid A-modifier LpxR family protein [Rhodovulum adriaticum]|nr:lipid A-modifier LpxR family protein [Rhodovulum adriaticum]
MALFMGGASFAEERKVLGYGRLFTNDAFGDGMDRWRTGSYTVSRVTGTSWAGQAPQRLGSLREYRLRGEIVAPANLVTPAPTDRRYAGIWSLGVHTHSIWHNTQLSLGGDLVITGPQTGLGQFQEWVHSMFDLRAPTLKNQIGDSINPTLVAQAVYPLDFGERVQIRPFVEAQAGFEDFVRGGADLVLGRVGRNELLLREQVTGQLYPGIRNDEGGVSVVLGGDIAKVFDSTLLPESQGYRLTDTRQRVRLGIRHEGRQTGVFYGLTWLGKEFKAQTDEQVVGSLRLRISF